MIRRMPLSLFLAAAFPFAGAWGDDPADLAPLRIHMISGSGEYRSEPSLRAFAEHLDARYRVEVSASWVKDSAKSLPDVDKIPGADLLIVFARRLDLPESEMEVLRAHWRGGKPLIGLRTASHAFQKTDNEVFDREVLGGNYQGHYGNEPTQIKAVEGAADHPILRGVSLTMAPGPLYKNTGHADDINLLLTGSIPEHTEPLAWTRQYKGGRIFYTSLGNVETFEQDDFRRMIAQALFWAAKREPAKKGQ